MSNLISMDKRYKTRDGRDVRVLCVDAFDDNYPVVALVGNEVYRFTSKGSFDMGCTRGYDLIEVPEEKTVWLGIYRRNHWADVTENAIAPHTSKELLEHSISSEGSDYKLIAIKKITYVEGEGI